MSTATLPPLPYDPEQVTCGVLHIGPGAFHRAHQLDYYNQALTRAPHWGVHCVSLQSRDLAAQLKAQSYEYVLAILDNQPDFRRIGAIRVLENVDQFLWVEPFHSADLHTVTLTITEKGYHLNSDGALDLAHPAVAADLAALRVDPDTKSYAPQTAVGLLFCGLMVRRAAELRPPLIVSCDNLVENGKKLRDAVISFAAQIDAGIADWIAQAVKFPSTMVDSITPAADDALRQRVQIETGFADQCPVQREAFTAWIIEDPGAHPIQELSHCGVVFTDNVAVHERAKLRVLNGSHSTLAYMGLAKGLTYVHQAARDPVLGEIIERQIYDEVIPGLETTRGLDLHFYADAVLQRFENPAIDHRLDQIAWDGSQKIPVRLMGTIAENIAAGRGIDYLSYGVAAWLRFLHRSARDQINITDPISQQLLEVAEPWTTAGSLVKGLADLRVFAPAIIENEIFCKALASAYQAVSALEAAP